MPAERPLFSQTGTKDNQCAREPGDQRFSQDEPQTLGRPRGVAFDETKAKRQLYYSNYYQQNKEYILDRRKLYREQHLDEQREREREAESRYRKRKQDQHRALQQQLYESGQIFPPPQPDGTTKTPPLSDAEKAERRAATQRRYYKKHKEQLLAYQRRYRQEKRNKQQEQKGMQIFPPHGRK